MNLIEIVKKRLEAKGWDFSSDYWDDEELAAFYEVVTETEAALAESFIEWKNKLYKEMRGGKLMFDVPKHHKWLDESELFTYWMEVGRYYNDTKKHRKHEK